MYKILNDTTWDVPFESPAALFERQVREHPDRQAVAETRLSLTYTELNEYANRIAHALLRYGLGREDLIMVLLPRNIMYYAVNIGILKAGAAFLPVSPGYPDERIRTIYEDAGCSGMIITRGLSQEHLDLLIDLHKRPLFLENLVTCERADNPEIQVSPGDLAYCIYTSGSTGKPKGVMIEQGNLSNYLQPGPKNPETTFIAGATGAMLSTTALTFDASLQEEFVTLCSGRTLVQATEAEILSPMLLRKLMDQYHTDAIICTPSYISTLFSFPLLKPALANFRVFDIGAEAFPPDLYEKIRAVCPDALIINSYGPTETTISCISRPVTSGGSVPLGRPGPNTQCFILGEDGQLLPPGETGELLICGKGVGRGYRNDPEKTAAAFIEYNGMRAYRSGDLACLTPEGEIEFHGRKDRQLKLKGLRIEPGEIEAVMARCPAVGLGAVQPIENRYLCYYYTLQDGTDAAKAEETVRAFAKSHLAHYMVPEYYMQLETMPVNANWKIDRARLPKPEITREQGREAETDIQKFILENVRNICQSQGVGTDTDLTEAGLSSLDWMVVIAVIGEKYGTVMDLADANRCRNVLGLEKFILKTPAVQAAEEVSDARATETQELYYCLEEISGLGETQMAVMVRLGKDISVNALTDAIRTAAAGHSGLFARFERQEDGLRILAPGSAEEAARNIRVERRAVSEDEMEEVVRNLSNERIPAEETENFRFIILETETAIRLFALFRHTIGDGSSVSILLDDILRSLDGREAAREKMNVYQFSQECDQLRQGADPKMISAYLDRLLDHAVLSEILSEKKTAIPDDFTSWTVPLSETEGEALCRAMNISETVLFAGITALALSRQAGGGKVPLLLACNGRSDVRLRQTFGFLVFPVLLCTDPDTELPAMEYFRRTARQYYDGISLPAFPLEELEARFPGWLDHILLFQGAEESHTLFGEEVVETWLTVEDEDRDQTEPLPKEAGRPSVIRQAAARWAADQTAYEVFVEDGAYNFVLEAPTGRVPAEIQQQILNDVHRISRILLANQNVRLEELLK